MLLVSVFAAVLIILGLLPQFPYFTIERSAVIKALLFTLATYAALFVWNFFYERRKSRTHDNDSSPREQSQGRDEANNLPTRDPS